MMVRVELSKIPKKYDDVNLQEKFKLTRYALEWLAFHEFNTDILTETISEDKHISGKVHKSEIELVTKVDEEEEPFFLYYPVQFIY